MHLVNFYDADDDVIAGASAFLAEGLREGEVVMALATEPHRHAIAEILQRDGLDVESLEDDGLYVPLDAATVMRSFIVDGTVDRELARQAVLPFLLAAAAKRRPMRAFGEVVSMLLQSGQLDDALVIEHVRKELAADFSCSLYCAYPARLVHETQSLHALDELCAHHTEVVTPASYHSTMAEASAPISVAAQSFLPVCDSVSAARNFVVSSLRGSDANEFLVGTVAVSAVQLLSHLQHNNPRPFRLGLTPLPNGVRVQIEHLVDVSDEASPNISGFRLLDRVTKEWGADRTHDTRVLWAVFSA